MDCPLLTITVMSIRTLRQSHIGVLETPSSQKPPFFHGISPPQSELSATQNKKIKGFNQKTKGKYQSV